MSPPCFYHLIFYVLTTSITETLKFNVLKPIKRIQCLRERERLVVRENSKIIKSKKTFDIGIVAS